MILKSIRRIPYFSGGSLKCGDVRVPHLYTQVYSYTLSCYMKYVQHWTVFLTLLEVTEDRLKHTMNFEFSSTVLPQKRASGRFLIRFSFPLRFLLERSSLDAGRSYLESHPHVFGYVIVIALLVQTPLCGQPLDTRLDWCRVAWSIHTNWIVRESKQKVVGEKHLSCSVFQSLFLECPPLYTLTSIIKS